MFDPMPSLPIDDEHGVRIFGDALGDFDEVLVHCIGIAPRHERANKRDARQLRTTSIRYSYRSIHRG
jgi:hypothetical protein